MALQVKIKKQTAAFQLAVDFCVQDGECLGVLGASGCGKSLTLQCIAGLVTPDEGQIILNERILFDAAQRINLPPQKRRIGYMFQHYALFPHLTVRENISLALPNKSSAKCDELLASFQLTEAADVYPRYLSGGQRQRTALARMLAAEPEVIMLDEPLSALDNYLKWQVEAQLKQRLAGDIRPQLFVSHSQAEIYSFCDRVAVLNRGHQECVASRQQLFAKPTTLAAAKLTGCKNYTAVQPLQPQQLWASDWQLELTTAEMVTEQLRYVAIRESDIILGGSGVNTFTAVIEYLGETVQGLTIQLRCGNGSPFWLSMPPGADLAVGSSVNITLPPDKLLLLS